jgi:nucleotide-binding universal stress UspA family protein
MYYKSILVHVSTSTHTLARCQIAARLAIQEDAHLVGTAATSLPIEFFLPGMVGETNAAIGLYLETMRTRAEGALAIFEAAAKQAGVSSIEPRIIEDEAASGIAQHSRYSDLVIIGQVDPDEMLPDMRGDFPQYVVLNSARPVLIIPYAGQFDEIGTNILIAWDASLEATRAVTAALPLLKRAKQVQVAVFNPNQGSQDHGELPGADIALYLARHGVKVEVARQITGGQIGIGDAILSHAADMGADMIVMGAYGHSRIRQILLGGVSDTIFKSMTIPVFMCH